MTVRDLFSFEGRMGRFAFLLTEIGVFVAVYLATFIFIIATGAGDENHAAVTQNQLLASGLGAFVFTVAAIWVALAAAVKRCHDRDLSGWMLLFAFPPVLGQLWLILSLATGPGTPGANRYGERARWFDALIDTPALSLTPA